MDRPVHVSARTDRAPQEIVVGAIGEEEGEEIGEEACFRYYKYDIDIAKPLVVAEYVDPSEGCFLDDHG